MTVETFPPVKQPSSSVKSPLSNSTTVSTSVQPSKHPLSRVCGPCTKVALEPVLTTRSSCSSEKTMPPEQV